MPWRLLLEFRAEEFIEEPLGHAGFSLILQTTTDVLYLNLSEVDARCGHGSWTVMRRRGPRTSDAPGDTPDGVACRSDWTLVSREPVRVHIHVFPRYEGDPFHLVADWSIRLTPLRLDQIAGRIRRAYEDRGRSTPGSSPDVGSAEAAVR